MTFTAIARCKQTGQLGVATQSHWPFVGSLVPWGWAGVGVVATQATTEPAYGPKALAQLQAGISPEPALQALLADDDAVDVRQVAILDNAGTVTHFTGARVTEVAATETRDGALFFGNLLTNENVVPAMANAWDDSDERPLSWRLLDALQAAQAAGGDLRGQQSAALLVVDGAKNEAWEGVVASIRIDDDPEPLDRLSHLLNVREAYNDARQGDIAATQGDVGRAITFYEQARAKLPASPEIAFWHAVLLLDAGRVDEAAVVFEISSAAGEGWVELAHRLRRSGRLSVPESSLRRVLGA